MPQANGGVTEKARAWGSEASITLLKKKKNI
jgi:hypothetical protein